MIIYHASVFFNTIKAPTFLIVFQKIFTRKKQPIISLLLFINIACNHVVPCRGESAALRFNFNFCLHWPNNVVFRHYNRRRKMVFANLTSMLNRNSWNIYFSLITFINDRDDHFGGGTSKYRHLQHTSLWDIDTAMST